MPILPWSERLSRLWQRPAFRRHPVRWAWRRLRWSLHWRGGDQPLWARFGNGRSIRLAQTSAALHVWLTGEVNDPEAVAVFAELLQPGMIACDCGAHVGEFTLLMAEWVGPTGQVHSFEPDPRVFACLEDSIARNGLRQVRANCLALADQDGEASFRLAGDPTESGLAGLAPAAGDAQSSAVQTVTLDRYLADHGLTGVDALRLDIEGAELAALQGAQRLLAEHPPKLWFIEVHRDELEQPLVELFEQHGYAVELLRRETDFPCLIARHAACPAPSSRGTQ